MKFAINVSIPITLIVDPFVNNQKDDPDNIATAFVAKIH